MAARSIMRPAANLPHLTSHELHRRFQRKMHFLLRVMHQTHRYGQNPLGTNVQSSSLPSCTAYATKAGSVWEIDDSCFGSSHKFCSTFCNTLFPLSLSFRARTMRSSPFASDLLAKTIYQGKLTLSFPAFVLLKLRAQLTNVDDFP